MKFQDLGITAEIIRALDELGFSEPTPIQEQSIPSLLQGKRDYIGLAQTGTGKTAAFGIPLISHTDTKKRFPQALILCPTRELCLQITKELKSYATHTPHLETVAIYGGASISEQVAALKRSAHVIVGTPGRVIDLINRKLLHLNNIKTVVLDEADEMLNMGFQEDIDTILSSTPPTRNIWLFSATMPREVEKIANNYMQEPLRVTIGSRNSSARNISHHFSLVRREYQYDAIKRFIDFYPQLFGMLFCRTKRDAQEIASKLARDGYQAEALHGDLSQTQRDMIMSKFRHHQFQLLVATDVAARGIDVNDITHVIHHNIPEDIEVYTHRSGRTARAGKSGISLAIITGNRDLRKIRMIEHQIGQTITNLPVPAGTEIYQKQLDHCAQTITNVVVPDAIKSALTKIAEKISALSKEEVLQRIFMLHFGKKMGSLEKASDINMPMPDMQKTKEYTPSAQRYSSGAITLQINIGHQQGFDKGRLLNFVCTQANITGRALGKIEIQSQISLVSIDDEQIANKIISSLKGASFNERKIVVDSVSKDRMRTFSSNRRFDRPRNARPYQQNRY